MTITDAVRAATDEKDFRDRVQFLIVKSAIAIFNEAVITAMHVERLALAKLILSGPETQVTRFALAAMTQPMPLAAARHSAIADNDLENAINGVYNSLTA